MIETIKLIFMIKFLRAYDLKMNESDVLNYSKICNYF